jgi:hypothetical protein
MEKDPECWVEMIKTSFLVKKAVVNVIFLGYNIYHYHEPRMPKQLAQRRLLKLSQEFIMLKTFMVV